MKVGPLVLIAGLTIHLGYAKLTSDEKDKLFTALDKQTEIAKDISKLVGKEFQLGTLTKLVDSISKIGSMLGPFVSAISTGMSFLKLIGVIETDDEVGEKIKELGDVMAQEFRRLNSRLDNILDEIKNEFQEQRLLDYRLKISNLQNKYHFYTLVPSNVTAAEFVNSCKLNDMADVLNEFHILMTSKQERSIRALMNFRHLPSRYQQYSKLFASLFLQARTLRALCLTIDQEHINDPSLEKLLNEEKKTHDEWFGHIEKALKEDLADLTKNWLKYAETNFKRKMDEEYDKYNWANLIKVIAKYMNDEYSMNPGKYSWGVAGCNKCTFDKEVIGPDKGAFKYWRGDTNKGFAIALYSAAPQTWKTVSAPSKIGLMVDMFYIRNHLGAFIRINRNFIYDLSPHLYIFTGVKELQRCDSWLECLKFSDEMTYSRYCKKEGSFCIEYDNP